MSLLLHIIVLLSCALMAIKLLSYIVLISGQVCLECLSWLCNLLKHF